MSFALAGGDRAWIVWTETRDRDGALRAAQRDGGGWSAAVTLTSAGVIARPGAVPAAIVPHDGPLLAVYASSIADGRGAALAQVDHEGRVSLIERAGGGVEAVWLSEVVNPLDRKRDTSVVFSSRDRAGKFGARRPLDARVCERGTIGAALTSRGLLFAWRSRNTWGEMDVIAAVISEGDLLRVDGLVRDGWRPRECPADGVVAAGAGRRAFIAWFTGADAARVKVATSLDGGRSFGGTLRADGGAPDGAVQIAMLGNEEAVVVWHEAGAMLARRIDAGDHLGATIRVADAPGIANTAAIARDGDALLLGWRDAGGVKLARIARAR